MLSYCPGPSQGLKIREGGLVVLGGDNMRPVVKIGSTDLPKTGGAKAPPRLRQPCCLIVGMHVS